MRLLGSLLLLAASSIGSVAAASGDKLAKFSAASTSAKSSKSGVVVLNSGLYDELVDAPRNYTAMVLLTALDAKYGCNMCKEFQPEYELLAKSWQAQHKGGDGLIFGVLDFGAGRETFMKLGLSTAPVLYLFPPTVGPDAQPKHTTDPLRFDFIQSEIPAELVATFISQHTPYQPRVIRPYDYTKAMIAVTTVIVTIPALVLSWSTLKPLLYSRNLWAAISLILILLFTSGHMFNHIRKVPYVVNNGRGGVSYIAGGFSNQFGLETQIVAVMYAILAFCAISLAMKIPMIEDPARQKLAVWAWNGVMMIAFSFLMSLFRQKNGGYPFKMPPFM